MRAQDIRKNFQRMKRDAKFEANTKKCEIFQIFDKKIN